MEHGFLQQLQKTELSHVTVIFTTRNPPTPLCSPSGVLPDTLATAAVLNSPKCVDTVISRQATHKSLIAHPDVQTLCFYTQARNNPHEQGIFDEISRRHNNKFHACQVKE